MTTLNDLVGFLDETLAIHAIADRSQNGLQVENSGKVTRVGLAVDASLATFEAARERGIDFLLVHHGLFWGQPENVTGPLYWRIKTLMDADMALYAAHLPLDLHETLGNNARIVAEAGWTDEGPFGLYQGTAIGRAAVLPQPLTRDAFAQSLQKILGVTPLAWPFGTSTIRRVAVVSGGGLGQMKEAAQAGFDAFVTGEPGHSSYWLASELGINVFFAGHYATETWGVKATGRLLTETFGLDVQFIDLPTGH